MTALAALTTDPLCEPFVVVGPPGDGACVFVVPIVVEVWVSVAPVLLVAVPVTVVAVPVTLATVVDVAARVLVVDVADATIIVGLTTFLIAVGQLIPSRLVHTASWISTACAA